MGNSIVVYSSKREQMMDQYWSSEEGFQMGLYLIGFLVFGIICLNLFQKR